MTGGPRLGDVEAGLVAGLVSPMFSVVSGGLACVAGAVLVAFAYPGSAGLARPPRPDVRSAA